MIGALGFPFFERADGSLPLPAEPPIVTLAAMGGRSRERKAVDCFSLPLSVVSPELLLVPLAGGAATDNRPTLPEFPRPGTVGKPEGSFPPHSLGNERGRCRAGVSYMRLAEKCSKRHVYRQRGQNGLSQRPPARLSRFACGSARETRGFGVSHGTLKRGWGRRVA
jgi:hypothetical protein